MRSKKPSNGTAPGNGDTRRSKTGRTKSVVATGRNRRANKGNGQAANQSPGISNSSPRKKTGKEIRTKGERNVKDRQGTDARESQKPNAASPPNEINKVAGSNRSQKSILSNADASVDESQKKSGKVPEGSREKVNTATTTKNENEVNDKEKQKSNRRLKTGNTSPPEDDDKVSDKDKSLPNHREMDARRSTSYEDISSRDDLSKTSRSLKRSFNSLHNVHINTHDKSRGAYDLPNQSSNLPLSQMTKDGTTGRKPENPQPESSTGGTPQTPNWVVLLSGLLILSPEEAVDHLLGSEYDGLLAREVVSDDELFIGVKVLAHASRSSGDPDKLKMLAYKIWQPHIIELMKTFSVTVEKYYPERAERYFWDLAEFLDIYVSYKLQIDKLPNLISASLSEVLVLSYKSYVSEELVNIYRKMQGKIYS